MVEGGECVVKRSWGEFDSMSAGGRDAGAGGQISPARVLHWYSHLRDGERSICAPADRADKVGIPVVGVTRLQIRRRNPEMVYFTPPSSLVCVVAP
jgi:hypothetical protein